MTRNEAEELVASKGRVTDFLGETEGTVKGWGGIDTLLVLWDGDESMGSEDYDSLWPAPAATPGP
jgi:hypothetical protein